MPRVVAFNCEEHADRLASLARRTDVEIRQARFEVPWEEIAARRAGRKLKVRPVLPSVQSDLAGAEIVFGFALPTGLTELAPHLRWVETPATGFDQLNGTGVLERQDITVTTAGSLFASIVAEHAFAMLLSLTRHLDAFRTAQAQREWAPAPVCELQGMTLGIVGVGNIGRALARAGKAFGMRVLGTKRSAERVPLGVDRLFAHTDLRAMLAEADVVVLSIAGGAKTANLIGAAELAAMKESAYLINVARGTVVDEHALAQALVSGRIGAAALDVFADEPLPPSSPLWRLPNVVITPHVAIRIESRLPRCLDHFAANLTRYQAGQALQGTVAGTP